MDYGSHYYRRAHWVKIIQACQNRPSDITAKQWLKDNGISDKSYYYWLKKLKTEKISQAKQSLPARDYNAGDISFVEVSDAVFGEERTGCLTTRFVVPRRVPQFIPLLRLPRQTILNRITT